MAKRGGLGQRGLDLLISVSPGAGKAEQQESESTGKTVTGSKAADKAKDAGSKGKAGSSKKSAGSKTAKKPASSSAGKTGTSKTSKTPKKAATGKSAAAGSGKTSGTAGTGTKTVQGRKKTVSEVNQAEAARTEAVRTEETMTEVAAAISESVVTNIENTENIVNESIKSENINTDIAVEAVSDLPDPDEVLSPEEEPIAAGKSSSEFDGSAAQVSNEPLMVPISQIEPNRGQPRRNFDEDSLQELADSIRQFGVIQPLIVQKKEDYYEIIAGERRWRASKIAGLRKLPVIVKEYTPRQVMEISLIENIQREDLNPIEEANAYRRLMEEYHLRQDEVAERVSRSRAAVANSVRLLNLDQRVQDMVVSEMLTTGHARALLALSDPEVQYTTAQRVFDEKLSVREVERLVRQLNAGPAAPVKSAVSDTLRAVYDGMTEQMRASLGTKVSIHPRSPQKGRIEIEYYSSDELDRLFALLQNPGSVSGDRG